MRFAKDVVCTEGNRNGHTALVRKNEKKRPLERPKRTCENIKIKYDVVTFSVYLRRETCSGQTWAQK